MTRGAQNGRDAAPVVELIADVVLFAATEGVSELAQAGKAVKVVEEANEARLAANLERRVIKPTGAAGGAAGEVEVAVGEANEARLAANVERRVIKPTGGAGDAAGEVEAAVGGQGAPRTGKRFSGGTEWVPDPRRPGVAQQELRALEAEYTSETGLRPEVLPRPPGVTTDAGFNPETGRIFVYDDVSPAFRDGFLAEELHHYQQVRDAGHLGRSLQEIEKLEPGFEVAMEQDVIGRVTGSGFIPYDSHNYVPYTKVPRPPGVAGN